LQSLKWSSIVEPAAASVTRKLDFQLFEYYIGLSSRQYSPLASSANIFHFIVFILVYQTGKMFKFVLVSPIPKQQHTFVFA
jgi:hypothetical protein